MKIVRGSKSVNNLQADFKPIQLGCYTLTEEGLEVEGRPSYEEHTQAATFIHWCVKISGWWLADLLNYADTRADWKKENEEGLDGLDVAPGTRRQYVYIAKKMPKERRKGLQFGHAAVIARAGLSTDQEDGLIEQALTENWTQGETGQHAREMKRASVISGQAALEGVFRVLYADPPWLYNDSRIPESGALGKASRHYPSMSIEDLCKLPVAAHAHEDSVLFMWTTMPFLLQNPGPREVIEAWGFEYKSNIVWDKVLHNFGHYVGCHHEHLLICTRGSCLPDELLPLEDSVQTIRRGDVHSEKPEDFRRIITKHYTRGPYLELFGRVPVEGWSVFGNDSRLWADEMEATA